ncbi:MAG: 50S ribosomal protein L21e [Candidatus Aenigmatarchaeota archaeon]|nr:MAG: 50S ribosomal protein L21e [Candidatus Aenigmarchaeota archaeon]
MTTFGKGLRKRTRRKLRKKLREKFTVTRFLQEFKKDERVVIEHEPSSQKGMPHPRFKGLIGVIAEKRGRAYVVNVKVGNKIKKIIARPEHLKPVK